MAISDENRKFYPALVYFTPPGEGFPWNCVKVDCLKKLEWWGYQTQN